MKPQTTEEFIQKSRKTHGDVYDYSKSRIVNNLTKVAVTCRTHGTFHILPANHYYHGQGCKKCAALARSEKRKKTLDYFIAAAQKIHGDRYEYIGPYNGTHRLTKIICSRHGEFETTPNYHVSSKHGCPSCAGKRKTQQIWIDEFKSVHGDKYDYSQSSVGLSNEKIIIICETHGPFSQTAACHKAGQGCPDCAYLSHYGRYSDKFFVHSPDRKDDSAFLYVLEFSGNSEQFIKVGITVTGAKQRIRNGRLSGKYDAKVLVDQPMTLYTAFLLEQDTLKTFKDFKYEPVLSFGGKTECLTLESKIDVINFITGAL